MSLINQMLQELEQRKAEGNASAAQVRAVHIPGRSRSVLPWILAALVLLAAAGVGYGLISGRQKPSIPSHPAPLAVAPAPGPAAPAAESTMPSVLQLAVELGEVPPAASSSAVPASPRPARSEPEERPPVLPAEPAVAAIKPSAKPVLLPQGDVTKDVKQLSPQQRAENAYRLAYNALQQGRMGEAEDSLRQALQFDPRHAAARQALAALLVEMKRLAQAAQLLQEGLRLLPGNAGFAMTLARIQVEQGDTAAALATLEHNPPVGENAEYHGFVAALLQRIGRHKDAIEQFQAALRLNPDTGPWLLGLGISLQADNQAAKAGEVFRHAMQSAGLTPELRAFAEQRLKQLQ